MIERIVSVHGNGGFLDFSTPSALAADLRRFVGEVAPTITPAALEAAAREFSWENEEQALLRLVDEVTAPPAAEPQEVPPVE
jgi:hypothetical protein